MTARLLPNNPYDGHTLAETMGSVERVTTVLVPDAYVDKGYRGHGMVGPANVRVADQRSSGSKAERKRRRRYSLPGRHLQVKLLVTRGQSVS